MEEVRDGTPLGRIIGSGAKDILRKERDFNVRAGFTAADDRLPDFFAEEPLPPHNTVFDVSHDELDTIFDF